MQEEYGLQCPNCGLSGRATYWEDNSGSAHWGRGDSRWYDLSRGFIAEFVTNYDPDTRKEHTHQEAPSCAACGVRASIRSSDLIDGGDA